VFLAVGVLAEGVLRARGRTPWQPVAPQISVEPGGRFYRADPVLGYGLLPGRFDVRFASGHHFVATHDADAQRVTASRERSGQGDVAGRPQRPAAQACVAEQAGGACEVWVFGASFTYGWAVDDDRTWPWFLQQALPERRVRNFAVSGYGTIHSVLQLESALRDRPAPEAVVLAYASFHDVRNTFVRVRRKRVAPFSRLGPLVQPWASLDERGRLVLRMASVEFTPWPGMRHSALIHTAEQLYDRWQLEHVDSAAVTDALVRRFVANGRAAGARVLIATLTRDAAARRTAAVARAAGAETVDLGVDLDRPGYRNLPHDAHPSGRAHRVYAQRVHRALARRRAH